MSDAQTAATEDLRERIAELHAELALRDRTLAQRDETLAARDEAIAALERRLRFTEEERDWLRRRYFGRKSEKLPADLPLFGELESTVSAVAETAPDDEGSTLTDQERKKSSRRSHGRRPLPAHLPRKRIELEVPEEDRGCGACSKTMPRIGEETSETLVYVPGHYEVHVHVRGKYACPCGEGSVVTAPAAARPIPRSFASPSLLAHVLVSKFDDHLPMYRQAEIFRRSGVDLARSTLCDWVGGVMPLLEPVADAIRRSVLAQGYVQADEIPVLVQRRPKERPKEAYLWAYRGGVTGEVSFDFRMGRSREGPCEVLRDYRGRLQVDGYPGYNKAIDDGGLDAFGCLAHMRRKFHEAMDSQPREAALVIVMLRRLYAIEARAADLSTEDTKALRAREALPYLTSLRDVIERLAADALPASRLGKACTYALGQWERLVRYATTGDVAPDNNAIERALRGIAVGRANWLFCGSPEGGRRAAVMYSIIESCKAAGAEPYAYLNDVLERLPTAPSSTVPDLTPAAWVARRS